MGLTKGRQACLLGVSSDLTEVLGITHNLTELGPDVGGFAQAQPKLRLEPKWLRTHKYMTSKIIPVGIRMGISSITRRCWPSPFQLYIYIYIYKYYICYDIDLA